MNEKEIRQLQRIFGEDRVFVINDKLSISKLPKLNDLLVIEDGEIQTEDTKENKWETQ